MSKIGKKPVSIPDGVNINIEPRLVTVKGPKGQLTIPVKKIITIKNEDNQIIVNRQNETKMAKALHGTIRNLIQNAILGVTQGYSKTLKLVGTGYRAKPEGQDLSISLGFSHPVVVKKPENIDFKLEGQDTIIISGIDKQLVGQTAANIRAKRPPEPYKGKGIRYENEYVAKKAGKAAKTEA